MVSSSVQLLQNLKDDERYNEDINRHHTKFSTAFPESGMPKFMNWGNI